MNAHQKGIIFLKMARGVSSGVSLTVNIRLLLKAYFFFFFSLLSKPPSAKPFEMRKNTRYALKCRTFSVKIRILTLPIFFPKFVSLSLFFFLSLSELASASLLRDTEKEKYPLNPDTIFAYADPIKKIRLLIL